MLRKAREGKVVLPPIPDFGFAANETRDSYVVYETNMPVARRIFRMVGDEECSTNGVMERLAARKRAEGLIFTRWTLVMYRFEQILYEDPDRDDLNGAWWDLLEQIQLVERPPAREEPDWAAKIHVAVAPVYYHNYVLGHLIATQLKDHLEEYVTHGAFYSHEAAGRYLHEWFFGFGARDNWRGIVLRATGGALDLAHFVRSIE